MSLKTLSRDAQEKPTEREKLRTTEQRWCWGSREWELGLTVSVAREETRESALLLETSSVAWDWER